MALRKEQRIEKRKHETPTGVIDRDHEIEELVFDLVCQQTGCTTKGGHVRFPIGHGRPSDHHLEDELKAKYAYRCKQHTSH